MVKTCLMCWAAVKSMLRARGWGMKGFLGIFLLGALGVVHAQNTIVKCVDRKGQVIYQTSPCLGSEGQKFVAAKRYEAVYDSPYAARRVQQAEAQLQRQAQMSGSGNAHYIRVDGRENPSACDAAKAYRDATLKAVGMRRTYDLLQQLDENVRRACR